MRRAILCLFALLSAAPCSAADHFVPGRMYSINRARYPDTVVICATEAAMDLYTDMVYQGKTAAAAKMVVRKVTDTTLHKLNKRTPCTQISSQSAATLVRKGKAGSHLADFMAFYAQPMWGHYLYFGAPMR